MFKLFFGPWLDLCFSELRVVCKRAAIKIGSFVEQFELLIILSRHHVILSYIASDVMRLIVMSHSGADSLVPWLMMEIIM